MGGRPSIGTLTLTITLKMSDFTDDFKLYTKDHVCIPNSNQI
jgi:hypothetical protein